MNTALYEGRHTTHRDAPLSNKWITLFLVPEFMLNERLKRCVLQGVWVVVFYGAGFSLLHVPALLQTQSHSLAALRQQQTVKGGIRVHQQMYQCVSFVVSPVLSQHPLTLDFGLLSAFIAGFCVGAENPEIPVHSLHSVA